MNTRQFFFIALLILIPQLTMGLTNYFRKITVADGLSSNFVRVIYKDSSGFMWFGTLDGLDRFDGTEIKSYKPKFPEEYQRVNCITDIPAHSIWVGTDKGLLFWDYVSAGFNKINLTNQNQPLTISTLLKLPGDTLLLAGTSEGIFMINTQNFQTRKIDTNREITNSEIITDIVYQKDDIVWFSSRYFIGQLDLKNDSCTIFINEIYGTEYSSFSSINLLGENIVVGTLTKGLFLFDTSQNKFERISKIESNYILSVEYSADGKLYIGTDGQGLIVYDTQNDSIKNYSYSISDQASLNSNAIYSLHIEENGRIWAGTYSGGVNYLQTTENFFTVTTYESDIYIGDQNIRSLYFDNVGNKYIGTDGNGIILILNDGRRFIFNNSNQFLRSNAILTIKPFKDKVLIGSFRGGISLFNKKTSRLENFRNENMFLNGSIYGFDFDKAGILWIGGLDGLSKIDTNTGQFKQFNNFNSIIKDQLIISIYFDSKDRLWTGSVNGGTHIYHISGDEITLVKNELDLSDIKAVSFFEDQRGNIWISSEGSGLIQVDSGLSQQQVFTTENGLPSNLVTAVTEAPENIFWVSTLKGLCRYDSKNGIFTKYSLSDGLPSLVFNRGALVNQYQKNGKLWFGSEKGLVSFYPDSLLNKQTDSKVIITDLYLSGQAIEPQANGILTRPVDQIQSLEVGAGHKNISFRFVALDYSSNVDNEFAFRLLNHNNNWAFTRDDRVTFSDLKPGNYELEIYHFTGSVSDQANAARLKITIHPPFYTKPHIIIVIALILLAIFTGVFIYAKRITDKIRLIKQGKRFRDHQSRYESSHLSNKQKKEIEELLVKYISENKPYLNPDLKLNDLASHVGCPAHYISQVLNQNLKQNFYDFINTYRVDAVKKCMTDPSYHKYTLLAIGQECGFNSKTSFYRAFKKITGKSPQEYQAQIKMDNHAPWV